MTNLETLDFFIFILKILTLILSLSFFGFTAYLLSKTDWLKRRFIFDLIEFFTFKPYGIPKFSKKWEKIIKRFERGSESEIKLAILEADDLLNEILERMGYSGETLGEKLKRVKKTVLPSLEEILEVHKIKSDIVHDPSYFLNFEQAKKILEIYKKVLSDLEAI